MATAMTMPHDELPLVTKDKQTRLPLIQCKKIRISARRSQSGARGGNPLDAGNGLVSCRWPI